MVLQSLSRIPGGADPLRAYVTLDANPTTALDTIKSTFRVLYFSLGLAIGSVHPGTKTRVSLKAIHYVWVEKSYQQISEVLLSFAWQVAEESERT